MTIITKGMGVVIKHLGKKRVKGKLGVKKPKRYGTIHSKLVKDKTKSKAEQTFDNVYKKDPTGKKDRAVKSMNEFLKKKKRKASPAMVDRYHAIMTSDPQYKPGKK